MLTDIHRDLGRCASYVNQGDFNVLGSKTPFLIVNQNISQGILVNGSVGKVVEFLTPLEAAKKGMRAIIAGSISALADNQGPASNQMRPQGFSKVRGSDNLWPVVLFKDAGAFLCTSESFEVNNAEGEIEATRSQVSSKF